MGQYSSLERSGKKQRSKPWRELYNGITNYRMWGLAACYAYTFGVEVWLCPPVPKATLRFAQDVSQGPLLLSLLSLAK